MHDDVLDPKMQKLVAALYGELSGEEEKEFQELLESDPALRAEWEELQASRFVLASLEGEETAPDFVFLTDEPRPAHGEPRDFAGRLRRWFGAGPAWGLAAAAVIVALLGLADFRIQRVDGGVAFRLGDAAPTQTAATRPADAQPPPAQSMDELLAQQDGVAVTPVGAGAPYMTRDDMDAYENQVLQLMRALLDDYQGYRDQELAGVIRALYSDVDQRQNETYDDLRGRIEALHVGLKQEQTESDLRYRNLIQNQARRLDDAPQDGPQNDQPEDDNQ